MTTFDHAHCGSTVYSIVFLYANTNVGKIENQSSVYPVAHTICYMQVPMYQATIYAYAYMPKLQNAPETYVN